jgi:hypothetical protein
MLNNLTMSGYSNVKIINTTEKIQIKNPKCIYFFPEDFRGTKVLTFYLSF